jgi:hypothetical protein
VDFHVGAVDPAFGVTSGAKFTRRELPTLPTPLVVEWVRKWHSAQMAFPCPTPGESMSVPGLPSPEMRLRCIPWYRKFVRVDAAAPEMLAKGSSAWQA